MIEMYTAKRLEDEYRARKQIVQLSMLRDIQAQVAHDLFIKKLKEMAEEASSIGGFLADAFSAEVTAVLHVLSRHSETQSQLPLSSQ